MKHPSAARIVIYRRYTGDTLPLERACIFKQLRIEFGRVNLIPIRPGMYQIGAAKLDLQVREIANVFEGERVPRLDAAETICDRRV